MANLKTLVRRTGGIERTRRTGSARPEPLRLPPRPLRRLQQRFQQQLHQGLLFFHLIMT